MGDVIKIDGVNPGYSVVYEDGEEDCDLADPQTCADICSANPDCDMFTHRGEEENQNKIKFVCYLYTAASTGCEYVFGEYSYAYTYLKKNLGCDTSPCQN